MWVTNTDTAWNAHGKGTNPCILWDSGGKNSLQNPYCPFLKTQGVLSDEIAII